MRSGYTTWHDAKKIQLKPQFALDDKHIAYWILAVDDVPVASIFGTPGCGFPMAMIERVDGSREIVDQNEASLGQTLDRIRQRGNPTSECPSCDSRGVCTGKCEEEEWPECEDDERFDGSMRAGIARYFRGAP
jgi:radical SAM protein with 4Fe4S-binding SPASM domain